MTSSTKKRVGKENETLTFYTEVCPDTSCTGRLEDLFSTFTVICRDQKHRGGHARDLQYSQQPRQSIATGMRKNLDDH
jgi:hypothetical protein